MAFSYAPGATTITVSVPAALVATTAALPSNTYSNGTGGVGATLTATANAALTVDGISVATGNVILVKNESTAANNGLYVVTNPGSSTAKYVLTRSTAMNTSSQFPGTVIAVIEGTSNKVTEWICTNSSNPTVGTTAITFSEVNVVTTSAGSLTIGGGYSVTLNATAPTTLTLPTSGTLTALGNTYTGIISDGAIVLSDSPAFTGTPTAPTATE
jgi:hypothetical protein